MFIKYRNLKSREFGLDINLEINKIILTIPINNNFELREKNNTLESLSDKTEL